MFPFTRFQITGTSMMPLFQPGDRVLVRRGGLIRKNDVVVFAKNGMTMIKRAAAKNGDHWHVRGDNYSASTDSLDFGDVPKRDIIGKVVAKY